MIYSMYCYVCMHAGIYYYGTHLVTTVDIMGVIVKKDVRDKLIIYAGKYAGFYFACHCHLQAVNAE